MTLPASIEHREQPARPLKHRPCFTIMGVGALGARVPASSLAALAAPSPGQRQPGRLCTAQLAALCAREHETATCPIGGDRQQRAPAHEAAPTGRCQSSVEMLATGEGSHCQLHRGPQADSPSGCKPCAIQEACARCSLTGVSRMGARRTNSGLPAWRAFESASRAPAGMRLWHSSGIWGNPLPLRCRHVSQRRQHRVGRALGRDETKSV
jgi:hypothetical protein